MDEESGLSTTPSGTATSSFSPLELASASSGELNETTPATGTTTSTDPDELHHRHINNNILELEEAAFDQAIGLWNNKESTTTTTSLPPTLQATPSDLRQVERISTRAWIWWVITIAIVAVWSNYLYAAAADTEVGANPTTTGLAGSTSSTTSLEPMTTVSQEFQPIPSFVCPTTTPSNNNATANKEYHTSHYTVETWSGDSETKLNQRNRMTNFTRHYIQPYLQQQQQQRTTTTVTLLDTSILNSGQDLYVTLQILVEAFWDTVPEPSWWIYGMDPGMEDTTSVYSVYRQDALPYQVYLGTLCSGVSFTDMMAVMQSANVQHAFDIAFTGYFPALQDPLALAEKDQGNNEEEEGFTPQQLYQKLCSIADVDPSAPELLRVAQEAQDNWMVQWLEQLVRATKPGGVMVVENVFLPFCQEQKEQVGGIAMGRWGDVVTEHPEWKVIQSSVETVPDSVWEGRYHVVMALEEEERQ